MWGLFNRCWAPNRREYIGGGGGGDRVHVRKIVYVPALVPCMDLDESTVICSKGVKLLGIHGKIRRILKKVNKIYRIYSSI